MDGDPGRRLWNEAVETLSRDAIAELQLRRLQRQLHYNHERSPVHRRKFAQVGARPEDIRSLEDFARIPVMTKDEHRRIQEESLERHGNPFTMMACAPAEEIVRINATSGTTGVPTLYTLTAHNVAIVNEMHARKYWRAGIRPGHVMLQALSLSMFTGGLPLSQGIMHLGACVVPVGIEGGTRRVIDIARITRPHAIVATPSFGQYLIEEAPRLTGRPATELGLRWFFCAGEGGGSNPAIRGTLEEGFGATVFDHTGGGHAFHGISCDQSAQCDGAMHFVSKTTACSSWSTRSTRRRSRSPTARSARWCSRSSTGAAARSCATRSATCCRYGPGRARAACPASASRSSAAPTTC